MADDADVPAARTGAAEREWNTAGAPTGEQFALWQQAVSQAFVPVTVRTSQQGAFTSGVTVRRLGPVDVADIAAPAQLVRRTADLVEQQVADVFFLNLPLTPGASVRQEGRSALLAAGDFAVVDGDRPFDLDFGSAFRQVSLKLPREVLQDRLSSPGEVTGVRVAGDRGVGAVASAAIRAAAASAATIDDRAARALGAQLGDLIALALGGLRPQPATTPQGLLLQAVLDEVERGLGDPALSPATVAGRLGISVRYLHRLFADHGPSFGRWVSTRRLQGAHRDLTDPERAGWTVARVAHHWGYADPSYFTRAFKRQYGVTPHELRVASAPPRSARTSY